MRIELDITDARIQSVTVTDWSDPDEVTLVGFDYDVATEDIDDAGLGSDDNGLRRYVSDAGASRSPQPVPAPPTPRPSPAQKAPEAFDCLRYTWKLARKGQAFSTRDAGARVLGDLLRDLYFLKPIEIVIDFTGVNSVSFSFIDEFFGRFAQQAHDKGLPTPVAACLNDAVRAELLNSLTYRGLPLFETDPED